MTKRVQKGGQRYDKKISYASFYNFHAYIICSRNNYKAYAYHAFDSHVLKVNVRLIGT